ncbi:hypothetical protein ACO2Q8_08545 [Larkinella sp. VNQ87]|uniref:hypothetical protein n=1 Tax=Larkinella sp. VNQ87 TaxID=3400921 RepID=UPI003C08C6EE
MKRTAGFALILLSFTFVYLSVQVYASDEARRMLEAYGSMAVVAKIGSVLLLTYLAYQSFIRGISMIRDE